MAFSKTFDTATPAGSNSPTEADDRMREIKAATQERENVDHFWPLTGTEVSDEDAGEHRKVTLRTGSAPTAVADKGFVYAKDVSGKAELFYRDEDGNEVQLTSAGKLGAADENLLALNATFGGALSVTGILTPLGDMNPTVYVDFAGGFIDDDTMADNAADKVASQQSIKAYVDDEVANITPATESGAAGSDGVTVFGNGFRVARGTKSVSANSEGTVSPSGFTAVYRASINIREDNNTDRQVVPKIGSYSGGTFTIRNTSANTRIYDWIAVGR